MRRLKIHISMPCFHSGTSNPWSSARIKTSGRCPGYLTGTLTCATLPPLASPSAPTAYRPLPPTTTPGAKPRPASTPPPAAHRLSDPGSAAGQPVDDLQPMRSLTATKPCRRSPQSDPPRLMGGRGFVIEVPFTGSTCVLCGTI